MLLGFFKLNNSYGFSKQDVSGTNNISIEQFDESRIFFSKLVPSYSSFMGVILLMFWYQGNL